MHVPDFQKWAELIRRPDWYLQIVPEFQKLDSLRETHNAAYQFIRSKVYDFFESGLTLGKIALGQSGKNWDAERKPIDTVVIHHTSMEPGLTKHRLSAVELIRLYATQYAASRYPEDAEITRQAIWSNHLRNGEQVFWPYHWMVRESGAVERLLDDHEIGWHAGNWDVNRRSVAICLDGDFEDTVPLDRMIIAAARIIREHYPQVSTDRIFGHCEVREGRICPSRLFLSAGEHDGWKRTLLQQLR